MATPQEWMDRLLPKLTAQATEVSMWESYYDGTYPLALHITTAEYREEFRSMLAGVRDNWMPMVVDATAERLGATGFRRSDETDGDKVAATIWQRNYLDADSELAHTAALTMGRCPILVWGTADDEAQVTVEHPSEVYVAYASENRRERIAAVKVWLDEWEGTRHARLWLPDATYRLDEEELDDGTTRWDVDETASSANPLGVVPIVELRNRQQLRDAGCRSELFSVTSTQQQVDKLLVDLLVASEFAAFRQRWGTGIEIPEDNDGEPIEDFQAAVDRLWHTAAPDARFGDFAATDLKQYIAVIANRVHSIATRTRTPPHYMLAGVEAQIPSGETIKSAETGLVKKVLSRQRTFGETWETVMRLAFSVENDPGADDYALETIWADPESRTEAEHVDATLKKMSLGVPKRQLWEDVGYTPAQIERFQSMLIEEGLNQLLAGQAGPAVAEAAVGMPAGVDLETLKAQADVMGALARAGVSGDEAAERVGLTGVTTVGMPASVRPTTDAAGELEPVGGSA